MVSSFVADALKPTGHGQPSQSQMDDCEWTWDQLAPSIRSQEVVQFTVKNEHVPR